MIGVVGRFAATTLLATGLLVSTFLLEFLVEGAVFLLVRDFFSIVVFSGFLLNCFTQVLIASGVPNLGNRQNSSGRQDIRGKQSWEPVFPGRRPTRWVNF